jgi:hypothetical protein
VNNVNVLPNFSFLKRSAFLIGCHNSRVAADILSLQVNI